MTISFYKPSKITLSKTRTLIYKKMLEGYSDISNNKLVWNNDFIKVDNTINEVFHSVYDSIFWDHVK